MTFIVIAKLIYFFQKKQMFKINVRFKIFAILLAIKSKNYTRNTKKNQQYRLTIKYYIRYKTITKQNLTFKLKFPDKILILIVSNYKFIKFYTYVQF